MRNALEQIIFNNIVTRATDIVKENPVYNSIDCAADIVGIRFYHRNRTELKEVCDWSLNIDYDDMVKLCVSAFKEVYLQYGKEV